MTFDFYEDIIKKEDDLLNLLQNNLFNKYLLEEFEEFYKEKLEILCIECEKSENPIILCLKFAIDDMLNFIDYKKREYDNNSYVNIEDIKGYLITNLFLNKYDSTVLNKRLKEMQIPQKNQKLKEEIMDSLTIVDELPDEEVPE